jgi:hypothetical protein
VRPTTVNIYQGILDTCKFLLKLMSEMCPQGYLCHPYLSLPYMDMLTDVNVRGYMIGATNVLFKQKNQLADVLVEVLNF